MEAGSEGEKEKDGGEEGEGERWSRRSRALQGPDWPKAKIIAPLTPSPPWLRKGLRHRRCHLGIQARHLSVPYLCP